MVNDFDTLLDQCLADMQAGRLTIEECLRLYPAQARRLAPLLTAAQCLARWPTLTPLSDSARSAIESRVLEHVMQLSQQSSRSSSAGRARWPLIGLLVLALM
jgi:hypothetical protein